MNTFLVNVRQKHIDLDPDGRNRLHNCAVAEAFKKQYPDEELNWVGFCTAVINGHRYLIQTPANNHILSWAARQAHKIPGPFTATLVKEES